MYRVSLPAGVPAGVKAVFFDAVGTLIHPDPPAPVVYEQVGRRFGSRLGADLIRERFRLAFRQEEEQDWASDLRTSEDREIRRWRHIVARVLDDVSDGEGCFQTLFHHFSMPAAWRAEPGAAAVGERLAGRGLLLGLASNYDRRLRSVAAGLPELRFFRHLVISSEVGWRKPAPEFFAALCRSAGLLPEQILLVGDDRVNDYDGARAFGMRALLYDPKNECAGGLERLAGLAELLTQ